MEMSQRIHFLYQSLPKMTILWEDGKKNHLFCKEFLDSLQNVILS